VKEFKTIEYVSYKDAFLLQFSNTSAFIDCDSLLSVFPLDFYHDIDDKFMVVSKYELTELQNLFFYFVFLNINIV